MMRTQIQEFTEYLKNVKHTSGNTIVSYKRDLERMAAYMEERGITDAQNVTQDSLHDYEVSLQDENFAPSSISRHNTSMKAFFRYMLESGNMEDNPAETLSNPKVEKTHVRVLTNVEVEELLSQDFGTDAKGLRDRAIMELMYATGLKTSEMIGLKVTNVDLGLSCIRLQGGGRNSKERLIPYGKKAKEALNLYLTEGRNVLMEGSPDSDVLFLNCSGEPMSRQGLWKLVKTCVSRAGIKSDITPFTLRHSFAAHLVESGADIASVQEMMGYCDSNTISRYLVRKKKSKDPFEWARIRN